MNTDYEIILIKKLTNGSWFFLNGWKVKFYNQKVLSQADFNEIALGYLRQQNGCLGYFQPPPFCATVVPTGNSKQMKTTWHENLIFKPLNILF